MSILLASFTCGLCLDLILLISNVKRKAICVPTTFETNSICAHVKEKGNESAIGVV